MSAKSSKSILWYDYETFGIDPARDRIAQFGAIRTDEELNIISEEYLSYCLPADDMLPHPDACLVTGITPQDCLEFGVPEYDFIKSILELMMQPGTCTVGYNSIRFDDEFTRYTLYRNLFDPYEREYKSGNSRWDLLDVVRAAHALRPDGMNWAYDEQGAPSFRLEALTEANGIEHGDAHDALADVRATIAIAQKLRSAQPKMFDYIYGLRSKASVSGQLTPLLNEAVVHVSGMYGTQNNCITLALPILQHPTNPNCVFSYDLRVAPAQFTDLSIDEMHRLLFTPTVELNDGEQRLPVKGIHINKAPVVLPRNTMRAQDADRLGIDLVQVEEHRQWLVHHGEQFIETLTAVFQKTPDFAQSTDPDTQLYGGFFSNEDREQMRRMHQVLPDEWPRFSEYFTDPRLSDLLFRLRARSFPETLDMEEGEQWEEYRYMRLTHSAGGGSLTAEQFDELIAQRYETATVEQQAVLEALQEWREGIIG